MEAERDELLKEEKELTRRKRASEIDGAVPALEVGGVN